jgi:hypothetical protein
MLTARALPGGFGKDIRFEVTASGSAVGTINETKSTFEIDGRSFDIARSGFLGPTLHLKSGDQLIATLSGKAFVNTYTLAFGGRERTFKATTLTARKFGLFENERQTGTVSSGSLFSGSKEITADLPEDLPHEVQLFLLFVFIGKLTTS